MPLLVSLICDAASLTYPALVVQATRTLADLVHAHHGATDELLACRVARRDAAGNSTSEGALQRMLYASAHRFLTSLRT